ISLASSAGCAAMRAQRSSWMRSSERRKPRGPRPRWSDIHAPPCSCRRFIHGDATSHAPNAMFTQLSTARYENFDATFRGSRSREVSKSAMRVSTSWPGLDASHMPARTCRTVTKLRQHGRLLSGDEVEVDGSAQTRTARRVHEPIGVDLDVLGEP